MNNNKNILLTFDYELFLGENSGSVVNCLLYPTQIILNVLKKYSFKNAIFFIDTTYLNILRNNKNSKAQIDFALIKNQIRSIVYEGHYIFPHIHPHWMDAIYNEEANTWNLSNISKYRINNVSDQERNMLFQDSVDILKFIIDDNIVLDSYRAGGWCIQPFDDFIPLFRKFRINNDFSVLRGCYNIDIGQYYDFSNTPNENIYYFSNNPLLKDDKGDFKEYVISTIHFSHINIFFDKLLKKLLWKIGVKNYGDGRSLIKSTSEYNNANKKQMAAIELLVYTSLSLYKQFIRKNKYMHFISHPKMFSAHNIWCFDRFLNHICSNYKIETDFRKMI